MKLAILIPHYRVGKITAYCVSQLLKHRGKHDIDIVVVDNNPDDGSVEYLDPYLKAITIVNYPKDKMQSHGIALDHVLPSIPHKYFLTTESDAFPTEGYLDYYESIIKKGYDCAGSLLTLSGGQYLHPCGAIYSKNIWEEAKKYTDSIEYKYFPNMGMKEEFPCHLMVHNRRVNDFLSNPDKYVRLYKDYEPYYPKLAEKKSYDYFPVCGVFHNGMGNAQEAFSTYRFRNIESEPANIILDNNEDIIFRMGYEPGQWLTYYQLATGRNLFYIPTETVWMDNRENQQQLHTMNETGFVHLWGATSYNGCKTEDVQDIVKFKEAQVEELWQSIQ